MKSSLNIIHLSDLHIDPNAPGESKPVFSSLCRKLRNFREKRQDETLFDLLVISGDLVDRGAGNYEAVEDRLNELLKAAGLSKDRVFIVPGNHDVVRGKCNDTGYTGIIESLQARPAGLKKRDDVMKDYLHSGFQTYQDFIAQFPLLQENAFDLPGFAQADLTLSNVPIRLCGLNTALVAGPLDDGKEDSELTNRISGLDLLVRMLDTKEDRLLFVVSHYPLLWIHEDERAQVKQRLKNASAVYFHGHIHVPETDVMGIQPDSKLLVLGVGALYGNKWHGRNHIQILELNAESSNPLLHEWFWSGDYGWRRFEPVGLSWEPWEQWRTLMEVERPLLPEPECPRVTLAPKCSELGLVNIGRSRRPAERTEYFEKVLASAAEGSEVIVVGRSLRDLSILHYLIETNIRDRKLHIKVALLDENTLPQKSKKTDSVTNRSWIELPIAKDWAMKDVPTSMEHFRRIRIGPNTGSLEIYGLPFYVSRSFVAYTNENDNQRYCLEEVGLALDEKARPFIELKAVPSDSYASSLESLYRGLMVEERLLLRKDGNSEVERDTTQRAKVIASKVQALGLVDIVINRKKSDWAFFDRDITEVIEQTPPGGEIFIMGRTAISWFRDGVHDKLVDAILDKGLKCTFVIADPTDPKLKSLVRRDEAGRELALVWDTISTKIYAALLPGKPTEKSSHNKLGSFESKLGSFELYGIPVYLPETFAAFERKDGIKYCTLEIGIGVPVDKRSFFCFQKVSDSDIYSRLNNIYRGILVDRSPLLRISKAGVEKNW